MTTNVDLSNRALAMIGSRSQLTSLTDGSPEATYCNLLYNEFRDFLLREGDYDWSLNLQPVVPTGSPAPFPWLFAYNYPTGAIRIRQMVPTTINILDPQPVEWNVTQGLASALEILTRVAMTSVVYTAAPIENDWDSIFTDSFVRMLASGLAFALENRIEAHREAIQEALSFAQIANMRDA